MTDSTSLGRTRKLLELTTTATGERFIRALAQGVAECLGVKHAMVGHQVPGDPSKMRLRAICTEGVFMPCFDYDLAGTPCADLLVAGHCHFPRGVAELFPEDTMLGEMGIESYLGLRVAAPGGHTGAMLFVLHDEPTEDISIELEAILGLLTQRASAEFEREYAEAALKESEARYRRIVDTCLEGVWGIDERGRTTFVNGRMAEMLGYRQEEMVGRPLFDFMDAAGRKIADENLERRKNGISEHHEFKLQHKSGHDVWTIMATNPVLEGGQYVGAMALVTDLTERRALENRVLQAQKLESLGVLAGGIAHDFNNLLVGILGNVGLARMELPSDSSVLPVLGDVEEAGLRLADLTRQMLAYSGKGRFVIERIDVNRVIGETTQLLASAISKKAELRYALSSERLLIEGDATQIRQVVMNLITNASDALEDREGSISVTTGLVEIDREYLRGSFVDQSLPVGTYVRIEVSDTGVGMTPETREKIFDPFFTTKFTGRGLGLAAVLGILRGHQGAIRVESESHRGSRFEVLLPSATMRMASQPAPAPTPSKPNGRRAGVVLVVDDEAHIRRLARRLLEQVGYEVVLAADGHEAVEAAARDARISVVLLDMTMPGLDGEEVFAHLRVSRPDIKVVLSSGYDEQDATARFAGRGLTGFLRKPWSPAELYESLETALGGLHVASAE